MRCLLVDDNERFVEIARRVLDPDGVKVIGTASTIAEAVLRFGELRPDIVLIDVMLGDENGFDLARRLAEGTALGFLSKAELSVDGIRRLLGEVR